MPPDPPVPPVPTHVMARVSESLDRVRGTIAKLGLRPQRVFFYREVYEPGEEPGDGEISGLPDEAEITPPPRVRSTILNVSTDRGGASTEGALRLTGISRKYRLEELAQRGIWDDDPPPNAIVYYAVTTDGQIFAQLYKVAGVPVLRPLGWEVSLRAVHRRVRLLSA